jgi:hypothetical protein
MSKAPAVIAFDFPYAGLLDGQWLSGPELPPSLAGRMSYNRIWAGVETGVFRFIPRIDPIQAVVAPASLGK